MILTNMLITELKENPTLRVLSLGAGVQSTVMALMTMTGEIKDKPDCAIFSDTGAEPKNVYEHLEWLTKQLDYPVYIVSKGNLFGLRTGINPAFNFCAMSVPKKKPLLSTPITLSIFLSAKLLINNSKQEVMAAGLFNKGVISLNPIPGFGKS